MTTALAETLRVETHARPVRVAYVLGPHSFTRQHVASILYDAQRYWGGRYRLVIPTNDTATSLAWPSLMDTLDPDEIWFADDVPLALAESLCLRHCPSYITELHAPPDGLISGFSHSHVPVRSLVRHFADHWLGLHSLRFLEVILTDHLPTRDTFQSLLLQFVLTLFGLSSPLLADRAAMQEVKTETIELGAACEEAVCSLLRRGSLSVPPKLLAGAYTQTPCVLEHAIRNIAIVVGDTPWDLAYAWNLDALRYSDDDFRRDHGHWPRTSVIWLPTTLSSSEAFRDALRTFLHSGSMVGVEPKQIQVVSLSERPETLSRIAEALSAPLSKWQWATPSTPTRLDPLSPTWPTMRRARQWNLQSRDVVTFLRSACTLPVPRPVFANSPRMTGHWAVDMHIEQRLDPNRVRLAMAAWQLPQRIGADGLLLANNEAPSRVGADGTCVTLCDTNRSSIDVQLPSRISVFRQLFCTRFRLADRKHVEPAQPPITGIRLGPLGQRFEALLQLFGSLTLIQHTIMDEPWSRVFAKMAGISQQPKPLQRATSLFHSRIRKHVESGSMTADEERDLIIEISRCHDSQPRSTSLSLSEIRAQIKSWARTRLGRKGGKLHEREIDELVAFHLGLLEWLVDKTILLRGFMPLCTVCGVTRWYPAEALGRPLACDGCRTTVPANAAGVKWSYRLNELVRTSLVDRGFLAMMRALTKLQPDMASPGPFAVGLELLGSGEAQPIGELDVSILVGKLLVVGEIKANPVLFRATDFSKSLELACAVQADVLLFGCPHEPQDAWARVEHHVQALCERNSTTPIKIMSQKLQHWLLADSVESSA